MTQTQPINNGSNNTSCSNIVDENAAAWATALAGGPQPITPPVPRLPINCVRDSTVIASSVSSPSAADSDCAEVDDLLEGIDRVRIDDLWTTPRASRALANASSCHDTLTYHHSGQHDHHHDHHHHHQLGCNGRSFATNTNTTEPTDYASLFAPPSSSLGPFAALPTPPSLSASDLSPTHSDHSSNPFYGTSHNTGCTGNSSSSPDSPSSQCSQQHQQSPFLSHINNDQLMQQSHSTTVFQKENSPTSICSPPESFDNHHSHHYNRFNNPNSTNSSNQNSTNQDISDFPRMFKVLPCPRRAECEASGETAECFYYHNPSLDRRRVNVTLYKPHMCRFVDENGGCRKGERCPFAHNDFERRYHPDRFGKETCRDFLRGDCPRRYCTFKHHVSKKVSIALEQMDSMADKEMLQFVLKISEERGRALCDKLLRRFGHGKKHSGWRMEGFVPHGSRDDLKVKHVASRVDQVKRRLKNAGEKKWAASLKTTSLRDMMSGVRKVAEEMRERCRADDSFHENGCEAHRLIRSVFSNTNWSCHSQEGDNPFLVTPENQNDAVTSLERLVDCLVEDGQIGGNNTGATSASGTGNNNNNSKGASKRSNAGNDGVCAGSVIEGRNIWGMGSTTVGQT